ncbi:MAG TPA: PaaI family thioesterase [Actinomycetota bacterium]|nr:PaaI family thioesterase [Actinomycetota bacterium]
MSGQPQVWQEPAVGGIADPAIFNLSGIEQIRAWDRGLVPAPPIARLTGIRISAAGEGTCSFTMPVHGWLVSPTGTYPIGVLAVFADPPLGCAIQTTLPAATPYTTAEMSITALRPVTPSSGTMVGNGTVIHAGRRMALSDVAILDAGGRLVAHGTSRCMTLPRLETLPPVDRLQPVAEPDDARDPWRREPAGAVVPQEVWESSDGLAICRGLIDGSLPRPPIEHLTGLRLTESAPGEATYILPASGWLTSPTGYVEGGMVALVADAAAQTAILTTAPAGTAVASVDLKVNFLRPCLPDGRDLIARGKVVHQGRSVVIAGSEVLNGDGKRVALATGSALLQPGRPAALD